MTNSENPIEPEGTLAHILISFHLMGGRATISDARKAAHVNAADAHVKKLIKLGLMERISTDDYRLTPSGFQEAVRLRSKQP